MNTNFVRAKQAVTKTQAELYQQIIDYHQTVLNRLINHILIGEPEKVDGVKIQEVRIVYNFVGEL